MRHKPPAILASLGRGRRAGPGRVWLAYAGSWPVTVALAVVVGALLLWMGVAP